MTRGLRDDDDWGRPVRKPETARQKIDGQLRRIRTRFPDISMDKHSQGIRICNLSENKGYSPRGTPKEITLWLAGFEEALDRLEDLGIVVRKTHVTVQGLGTTSLDKRE